MTCSDAQGLLHAYVDGEFDPVERRDFDAHVRACEACHGIVRFEAWFRDGLRESLPVPVAPQELHARVRADVRRSVGPDQAPLPLWAAAPAALAVAAVVTVVVMAWDAVDTPSTPVVDAVSMHRRDLPAEVGPATPDDVRRWFWGKVNFPVQAPVQGVAGAVPARFLGARVSHVGRFPAAHLMYDVGGARVSVMAFQGPGQAMPSREVRRVGARTVHFDKLDGYNVAFSRSGDVTYAVTGDVPTARMVGFLPTSAP